jgi:hypothetical protein
MPPAAKGPRLWLRKAQRDRTGKVTHHAIWLIRDGSYQESTRCGASDRRKAEQALADYITRKHLAEAAKGERDPSRIPVADVIALYANDVALKHARPKESAQRARALLAFFGDKMLSEINGGLCRAYVAQRSSDAAARRDADGGDSGIEN